MGCILLAVNMYLCSESAYYPLEFLCLLHNEVFFVVSECFTSPVQHLTFFCCN